MDLGLCVRGQKLTDTGQEAGLALLLQVRPLLEPSPRELPHGQCLRSEQSSRFFAAIEGRSSLCVSTDLGRWKGLLQAPQSGHSELPIALDPMVKKEEWMGVSSAPL